jgi:hypothetical protein
LRVHNSFVILELVIMVVEDVYKKNVKIVCTFYKI